MDDTSREESVSIMSLGKRMNFKNVANSMLSAACWEDLYLREFSPPKSKLIT